MANQETTVNVTRNPQLYIGSREVPAIIVPILLSVLFGIYKKWQQNRPLIMIRVPRLEPKKQATKSEADTKHLELEQESAEEHWSSPQTMVLWMVRGAWGVGFEALIAVPIWIRSEIPHRNLIRAISAGSLLAVLAIYTCLEKGNTHFHAKVVAAAAAGLVIHQDVLGHPAPWNWTFTVPTILLALLSWWPVPQESSQRSYGLVSTLLLTLIENMYFPESWWYDDSGKFSPSADWINKLCLLPVVIFFGWGYICTRLGLSPTDKGNVKVYPVGEILREVLSAVSGFAIGLLFIGGYMLIAFLISFATSCIAIDRLVLGLDYPPSFWLNPYGKLVATFAYGYATMQTMDENRRWNVNRLIDGVGWSIAGSLALGLVLMAVEQIRS